MRLWPARVRVSRPEMFGPTEYLRNGTAIRYLKRGWRVERWGPGGNGASESLSLRFAWKHAPTVSPGPGWFGPLLLVVGAIEVAGGHSGLCAAFLGVALISVRKQPWRR